MKKPAILFVCTHNSARSQMAEGILRNLHGDRYEVFSAGTHPSRVHPLAIKALEEIGVDISGHSSKGLEELAGVKFDLAVTVCDQAKDACPIVPGAQRVIHKGFEDPAAINDLEMFRKARDEIRNWIEKNFQKPDIMIQS